MKGDGTGVGRVHMAFTLSVMLLTFIDTDSFIITNCKLGMSYLKHLENEYVSLFRSIIPVMCIPMIPTLKS